MEIIGCLSTKIKWRWTLSSFSNNRSKMIIGNHETKTPVVTAFFSLWNCGATSLFLMALELKIPTFYIIFIAFNRMMSSFFIEMKYIQNWLTINDMDQTSPLVIFYLQTKNYLPSIKKVQQGLKSKCYSDFDSATFSQ